MSLKYYVIYSPRVFAKQYLAGEDKSSAIACAAANFKYGTLLIEDDLEETTLVDAIEDYLRYEASEGELIELYNEWAERNSYSFIETYGSAKEYWENMCYSDAEEMLEHIVSFYENGVPFEGEYIKLDEGNGDIVGDFDDVWDDGDYTVLAGWCADGYGDNSNVKQIIDEFYDADWYYEEWKENKDE